MIKAEKLTFGFNSNLLFQNISFSLEENCHCALIGLAKNVLETCISILGFSAPEKM